ncbi:hypothetical protein GCM10014713_44700 [Streptomyces purpureus]|uniref:SnoaL-like domain-containing protein n=2 Tax=Streptomyces purpureus TaxID=1951 RepID=A0A918HAN6_9ACTN|nr:hypothetical protein GCM10014713_44700 [Streptomyces purpureus]
MAPHAMKCQFIDNPPCPQHTAFMTTENETLVEKALSKLIGRGDARAAPEGRLRSSRPDASSSSKTEWLAAVRAVPIADLRVEIHHVLADGDHVVMHSRRWIPGAGPGIAGVDIWRLEDGLIAEGWEIIEPVTEAASHVVWWEPVPPAADARP